MRKAAAWRAGVWLAAAALLAGCSAAPAPDSRSNETSQTEFQIGDAVATAWFEYTILHVQAADIYEEYAASSGSELIVVELSIRNTFQKLVPLFDADFQLYWGAYREDEWALPIAQFCNDQLPMEYILSAGETWEGVLLYEVPVAASDFTFAFLERFNNGTEEGEDGSLFLTYFSV